jgi:hypothetical protein
MATLKGGKQPRVRWLHTYSTKPTTNERRRKSSPISSLKAKIRIIHAAFEENEPSPTLTYKVKTIHYEIEIEQSRATFSNNTQTAKNNTAKEELLTKNFSPPSNPKPKTEI